MTGAPGYWMDEISGVLRPAIIAYFHGCELSADQIAALRAYLRQWIMAPVWDANPYAGDADRARLARLRTAIAGLTSREAISGWLDEAVDQGLDPL